MSVTDLGEEGRSYLRASLSGASGIAGMWVANISGGQCYTYFPIARRPIDFESGGGVPMGVGMRELLSETHRLGAEGDILVLQDIWALQADHAATIGMKITLDGAVYLLQSWNGLTAESLDALLRKCISFVRVLFLVDVAGAVALKGAKTEPDLGAVLSSVKLVAVSAFDQEGYIYWRP